VVVRGFLIKDEDIYVEKVPRRTNNSIEVYQQFGPCPDIRLFEFKYPIVQTLAY
jgi:hypothetical protein